MSKKERVKTKLDLLKVLIVAILTSLFGATGYLVTRYYEMTFVSIFATIVGIVALLFVLLRLLRSFNKELDKLEKM